MLSLNLRPGEYMTIGGDVVVQLDRMSGDRCKLLIDAPRELTVLRGEVLERGGGQRPACVFDAPRQIVKQLPWNGEKKRALLEIGQTLDRMGDSPEVRTLREKLACIFPAP